MYHLSCKLCRRHAGIADTVVKQRDDLGSLRTLREFLSRSAAACRFSRNMESTSDDKIKMGKQATCI